MTVVILVALKTAISLPDRLFHEAEEFARRKGMSRSELYAYALQLFLQSQQADHVTAAVDAIYTEEASTLDPLVRAAQVRVLAEDPW